jgi:hypothetical protein
MLNTALLVILVGLIIYIGAILTYEFLDLNDFAFLHKKPKYTVIPAECFPKKVTLGDLCELCPETIFKVVDGNGGFAMINPQDIDSKKLSIYKTLSAYNLDTQNQTLEVSDPSLL